MIKLNFVAFIISLAISIFVSYTTLDKKKIIYVYPNPDNYKTIQYKDKNGACMDVKASKIECNSNIKSHPIYI